jgi:hypothetical protein
MDFPAYVPAAVRRDIESRIYGDQHNPHGWAHSLESAESALSDAEAKLQAAIRISDTNLCARLRSEKLEAKKHRDSIAGEIQCLQRLAHDARMRDAYATLTAEFTDDRQWCNLIYAAWAARVDYTKFREKLKKADSLRVEIADAADKLANLINQFCDTGVYGPWEFHSVETLLETTDNHELNDHDLYMWRAMRKYIFGTDQCDMVTVVEDDSDSEGTFETANPQISFVVPDTHLGIDPVKQARSTLRYAWEKAPSMSALIRTLGASARAFAPAEGGMIGAAISTRQSNPATEYVRAFAYLLTDTHGFKLTAPIMRAMAVIATVVIGESNTDITYDNIRKTVANLG